MVTKEIVTLALIKFFVIHINPPFTFPALRLS